MGNRFTIKSERESIHEGMRQRQHEIGRTVLWFDFDVVASQQGGVYAEPGPLGGRRWRAPIYLPVLWVIRTEGDPQRTERGYFAPARGLRASFSYRQAERAGMPDPGDYQRHHHARLIYRGGVYRVDSYQTQGEVQDESTVVGIVASEVTPDELLNDPDFQAYASENPPP